MIGIVLFTALMTAPLVHAEARLILDESTVLPCTPTGFTIIVTNPGKTALQLPLGLWLVATECGASSSTVLMCGRDGRAG